MDAGLSLDRGICGDMAMECVHNGTRLRWHSDHAGELTGATGTEAPVTWIAHTIWSSCIGGGATQRESALASSSSFRQSVSGPLAGDVEHGPALRAEHDDCHHRLGVAGGDHDQTGRAAGDNSGRSDRHARHVGR